MGEAKTFSLLHTSRRQGKERETHGTLGRVAVLPGESSSSSHVRADEEKDVVSQKQGCLTFAHVGNRIKRLFDRSLNNQSLVLSRPSVSPFQFTHPNDFQSHHVSIPIHSAESEAPPSLDTPDGRILACIPIVSPAAKFANPQKVPAQGKKKRVISHRTGAPSRGRK